MHWRHPAAILEEKQWPNNRDAQISAHSIGQWTTSFWPLGESAQLKWRHVHKVYTLLLYSTPSLQSQFKDWSVYILYQSLRVQTNIEWPDVLTPAESLSSLWPLRKTLLGLKTSGPKPFLCMYTLCPSGRLVVLQQLILFSQCLRVLHHLLRNTRSRFDEGLIQQNFLSLARNYLGTRCKNANSMTFCLVSFLAIGKICLCS